MSSTYPEDGAGGAPLPMPDQRSSQGQAADARDKISEAGATVRAEAAHFAERARDQVAETVEAKTEAVTEALAVFADAIRKAGDELGGQDQTFAAKLAGQAADGLQSFSRTLSGKSPEDMLHAARDLGRSNPTAFLAGAVLAGVAIGRFARSSAEHGPETTAPPPPPASSGGETGAFEDDAPEHRPGASAFETEL